MCEIPDMKIYFRKRIYYKKYLLAHGARSACDASAWLPVCSCLCDFYVSRKTQKVFKWILTIFLEELDVWLVVTD